ncbi:MAG TPA: hypothetical protein VMW42_06195, partial [Desulfatiglandales bacterium]|nr:hypothetical protein [Desulfatiglandales bacterium]
MNHPNPPDYGSGPVNFTGAGKDAGPFAAFDNTINYQNMIRYQMVTQYNQSNPTQYNMPPSMQAKILQDSRYSYGVPGGQDASYYNRQADLNRTSYAAAIASGTVNMTAWGIAAAGAAGLGFGAAGALPYAGGAATAVIGGGIGAAAMGLLAPIAATIPIGMMVGKKLEDITTRQKYMHTIALDLQMNRDKMGMGGLSYDQATGAGRNVTDFMMDKGYFDPSQKMKIHQIGISSGMLSAAGAKAGSTQQYEKNFKELVKATEDIVKVMQTTIEGGMSLIKEVNQIGFKTLPQVKSQIRGAKAFGAATGLGFQNMMQIGEAGALSVQGTPWKASVGASMHQMGAMAAHAVAAASPAGAFAVEKVGGVAQAGAVVARAQMNMMSSGIGTRMAAYAMNPDGTINEGRMNTLLSGKPSAYEIVSGANRVGYQMGTSRVRFDMFKEDMMNQMSDVQRAQFFNVGFNKWRGGRGGSALDQAAA